MRNRRDDMIRGEMRKTEKRWLNKAEDGTEEKWKMENGESEENK